MIFGYTDQGKNHVNQDVIGWCKDTAWVIDGATPLFGDDLLGGNDVQKTMRKISGHLQGASAKLSLEDNLVSACRAVEQEYRREVFGYDSIAKYKLPTFACSMVRIERDRVEWYSIGDCEIFLHGEILRDVAFDRINARNAREVPDKITLYRSTRKLLNTGDPEGYWIGSLDGLGCKYGISGSVSRKGTERIYLYSDGMAALLAGKTLLSRHVHIQSEAFETYIRENRYRTADDISIVQIDCDGE